MMGDMYGSVRKGRRGGDGQREGETSMRLTVVLLDNILEGRAKGLLYWRT